MFAFFNGFITTIIAANAAKKSSFNFINIDLAEKMLYYSFMNLLAHSKKYQFTIIFDYKNRLKDYVSVDDLAKFLSTIQDIFIKFGTFELEKYPIAKKEIYDPLQECKIYFIKAYRRSSLSVNVVINKPTAISHSHLNQKVLNDFYRLSKAIKEDAADEIQNILPNPEYRKDIIEKFSHAFPSEDHIVSFSFPSGRIDSISKPKKEQILKYIGDLKSEEAKEECAEETIIEASCIVKFNKDGEPKPIKIIKYDLSEGEYESPYSTQKISYEGRIFILNREISCNVNSELLT